MARSWTLVPTPIFSVEPTRTATWPERQAANSRALFRVGLGFVDEPDRFSRASPRAASWSRSSS